MKPALILVKWGDISKIEVFFEIDFSDCKNENLQLGTALDLYSLKRILCDYIFFSIPRIKKGLAFKD